MRHQTVGAKGTQRLFKRNEKQHSNQAKTTTLLMPKPRQKGLEANPIETRTCRICRPPLRPSSTDHLNIGYVPTSLRDVKCLFVIRRSLAECGASACSCPARWSCSQVLLFLGDSTVGQPPVHFVENLMRDIVICQLL